MTSIADRVRTLVALCFLGLATACGGGGGGGGPTDAEAVAEAKAALAIGYQGADGASSVTLDVALPTSGLHGTTVSWTSDGAAVTDAGVVTRPSFEDDDASVNLTATISRGAASDTRGFALTVLHRTDLVWTFVDGAAATGLNHDPARNALDLALAVLGTDLYVAWTENNASTTQIRVRKYDGTSWTWLDGGGTTGINHDTAASASKPSLLAAGGYVYAVWSELYGSASVIRAKRWDPIGATWTRIDDSDTAGLNRQSVTAEDPTLATCNGVVYAAWVEAYGAMQVRVKKYAGGVWSFLDGGGLTGLNYSTTRSASAPRLACHGGSLYLIWAESTDSPDQIRVRRYDELTSAWTFVDGNRVDGLNYDAARGAGKPGLAALDGTLYAYWVENYFVRVKRYSTGAWSSADGNAGFKHYAFTYAYTEAPPVAVPSGSGRTLLFTWGEDIVADPWAYQTRVAAYDGSGMTFLDGDSATAGLNWNWQRYAYAPQLAVMGDAVYVAWYESNGTANQLRVKRGTSGDP